MIQEDAASEKRQYIIDTLCLLDGIKPPTATSIFQVLMNFHEKFPTLVPELINEPDQAIGWLLIATINVDVNQSPKIEFHQHYDRKGLSANTKKALNTFILNQPQNIILASWLYSRLQEIFPTKPFEELSLVESQINFFESILISRRVLKNPNLLTRV